MPPPLMCGLTRNKHMLTQAQIQGQTHHPITEACTSPRSHTPLIWAMTTRVPHCLLPAHINFHTRSQAVTTPEPRQRSRALERLRPGPAGRAPPRW